MIVEEIYQELIESTGSSDQAVNLRVLSRAIEILANKGLFDPLVGYYDFVVQDTLDVALPADVKSIIALTIDDNPAFARSRFFEFAQNTDGTLEGPKAG